jgi:hypothetical protein
MRKLLLAGIVALVAGAPTAHAAPPGCPGHQYFTQEQCDQLADSHALLTQQWASLIETIDNIRVYDGCRLVEHGAAVVAISNLEIQMQDLQISDGVPYNFDDPTLNIRKLSDAAISRADAFSQKPGVCQGI